MSGLVPVFNYLVPAVGTTKAYTFNDPLVADVPAQINWAQISLDGDRFTPSGLLCNNDTGANIRVIVSGTGYEIVIPVGANLQMPYPAPLDHTVTILCASSVQPKITFVDYPVIPFVLFP